MRNFKLKLLGLVRTIWLSETAQSEMFELSNSSEAIAEDLFDISNISLSAVSLKINKAKPNPFSTKLANNSSLNKDI